MLVQDPARYRELAEAIAAEGVSFWDRAFDYETLNGAVRAIANEEQIALWEELLLELGTIDGETLYHEIHDVLAPADDWMLHSTDLTVGTTHDGRDDSTPAQDAHAERRRFYNWAMTKYYDETFGWVPLQELAEGEREPREGDFRAAGESWREIDDDAIESYREGRAREEELQRLDMLRHFSYGFSKLYDVRKDAWEPLPGDVKPAVGDVRLKEPGELVPLGPNFSDRFEPVDVAMIARHAAQLDDRKNEARARIGKAVREAKVSVQLRWPGDQFSGKIGKNELVRVLSAAELPGARETVAELENLALSGQGMHARTLVPDQSGLGCVLTAVAEITMTDIVDDEGVDGTFFIAKAGWSFKALIDRDFVRQYNNKALKALKELGMRAEVELVRFGDLVVLKNEDQEVQFDSMHKLIDIFRADIFGKQGGLAYEEGVVRRTTHLGRTVLKTDADKAVVAKAMKEAGWKAPVITLV